MEQTEEECQTIEDIVDFITFALQSVKHSTVHRTRIGDKKKRIAECQGPRTVGLLDTSIHTREGGTTVQLCGDSNVAENGQMVILLWDKNSDEK